MKIAFILSNFVISPTNGIVSQAKTWKKGLEKMGHEVILIDMWEKNDWASFDILQFFGFSSDMSHFIKSIYKINPNIVVSPILDPNYSKRRLKVYANWGIEKFNLSNSYHGLNQVKSLIKAILVRSEFEKNYMIEGFNFKREICHVVPLSYGVNNESIVNEKQPFCLHISLLADERKNVKRLIDAAKKYNFKLVLGGKLRNRQELITLQSWIGNNTNIEYGGYLSKEELLELYSKAKVFALPSTNEGVGIVALEAASMGCDIVMTELGGPKEYYNGLANLVNPFSIDSIGKSILNFLKDNNTFQPELKHHVLQNFSLEMVSSRLVDIYSLLHND